MSSYSRDRFYRCYSWVFFSRQIVLAGVDRKNRLFSGINKYIFSHFLNLEFWQWLVWLVLSAGILIIWPDVLQWNNWTVLQGLWTLNSRHTRTDTHTIIVKGYQTHIADLGFQHQWWCMFHFHILSTHFPHCSTVNQTEISVEILISSWLNFIYRIYKIKIFNFSLCGWNKFFCWGKINFFIGEK